MGQLMPKSQFSEAYDLFLAVLIAARKDAGLTQAELARRVGRDQPFISLAEKGVRRLDVIEFCVLARAMERNPQALFAKVVDVLPAEIEI